MARRDQNRNLEICVQLFSYLLPHFSGQVCSLTLASTSILIYLFYNFTICICTFYLRFICLSHHSGIIKRKMVCQDQNRNLEIFDQLSSYLLPHFSDQACSLTLASTSILIYLFYNFIICICIFYPRFIWLSYHSGTTVRKMVRRDQNWNLEICVLVFHRMS